MKLDGEYVFDAPAGAVWQALFDAEVLAAVMPGCERLDVADGVYTGDLNVKVGPVQGRFATKIETRDVVAPKSYALTIDGRGPAGFLKATADVELAEDGAQTRMRYKVDASVGGKVATVGQRLIDASAKAIAKQSLDGLHANVKARMAVAVPQSAPVADPQAPDVAAPAGSPPAPAPAPVVKTDNAAFAAGVAREVAKDLLPPPVLYGMLVFLAVAVLAGAYLVFGR